MFSLTFGAILKKGKVEHELKHYLQKFDYDCGPGVVGLVLKNAGYDSINHRELMRMLETSKDGGTNLVKLTKFFLCLPEFDAKPKIFSTWQDLRDELDNHRFSIVAYQNWSEPEDFDKLESGHYALVVGLEEDKIKLLDPGIEGGEFEFSRRDFEQRWIEVDGESGVEIFKNWMMSLHIPDKTIPSFKERVLNAVDNLLSAALGTPPEYEEALKGFRHDENCSRSLPLKKTEEQYFPTFGDGGVWGTAVSNMPISLKYIECSECHASVRYSD